MNVKRWLGFFFYNFFLWNLNLKEKRRSSSRITRRKRDLEWLALRVAHSGERVIYPRNHDKRDAFKEKRKTWNKQPRKKRENFSIYVSSWASRRARRQKSRTVKMRKIQKKKLKKKSWLTFSASHFSLLIFAMFLNFSLRNFKRIERSKSLKYFNF